MREERDIFGTGETTLEELNVQPEGMPAIEPKSGWKTSEGQMTFLFVVAAMVFAWFKVPVSAEQLQTGYGMVVGLIEQIGPIAAAAIALWNYITSRGKTKSNAIHATAAVALKGDIFGSLLGGKSWKDPDRYIGMGRIAAESGIIPGPAGKIAGKILGGDDESESGYSVDDCVSAIQTLDGRVKKLEGK